MRRYFVGLALFALIGCNAADKCPCAGGDAQSGVDTTCMDSAGPVDPGVPDEPLVTESSMSDEKGGFASYYAPIGYQAEPGIEAYELPLEAVGISNLEDVAQKLQLSVSAQEALLANGFVVVPYGQTEDIAAPYATLKEMEVPAYITTDTWLHLYHVQFDELLKTLEEPPSQTLFILVSAAEHLLLPTVLSRCQRIRFSPLAEDKVVGVLVTLGEDSAVAKRAAALSDGSVGKAQRLIRQGRVDGLTGWMDLVKTLGRMSPADRLRNVSTLLASTGGKGGDRAGLDQFIAATRAWLEIRLRDLSARDGPERSEQEKLLSLFETLRDIDASARVNANPKLLADNLAGRLAENSGRPAIGAG